MNEFKLFLDSKKFPDLGDTPIGLEEMTFFLKRDLHPIDNPAPNRFAIADHLFYPPRMYSPLEYFIIPFAISEHNYHREPNSSYYVVYD